MQHAESPLDQTFGILVRKKEQSVSPSQALVPCRFDAVTDFALVLSPFSFLWELLDDMHERFEREICLCGLVPKFWQSILFCGLEPR